MCSPDTRDPQADSSWALGALLRTRTNKEEFRQTIQLTLTLKHEVNNGNRLPQRRCHYNMNSTVTVQLTLFIWMKTAPLCLLSSWNNISSGALQQPRCTSSWPFSKFGLHRHLESCHNTACAPKLVIYQRFPPAGFETDMFCYRSLSLLKGMKMFGGFRHIPLSIDDTDVNDWTSLHVTFLKKTHNESIKPFKRTCSSGIRTCQVPFCSSVKFFCAPTSVGE